MYINGHFASLFSLEINVEKMLNFDNSQMTIDLTRDICTK